MGEAVAEVLIICRYSMHFVRVLMLLKMTKLLHRSRGRTGSDWEVKFSRLEDLDDGVDMVAEMVNISADFSDGFSDEECYDREKTIISNSKFGHTGPERPSDGSTSSSVTLFDRYASLIVDQPHVHGPNEDHEPYRDVSPVQCPRGKSAEDVPKSASQHQ